jgi:uncharacterized protein YndB with AHSA1/START domain
MPIGPQDDTGSRSVSVRREYPQPLPEVWAALTQPDLLARWYGVVTGAGGAGGTVEVTMTAEIEAGAEEAPPTVVTVVECDPPDPASARLVLDIPLAEDQVWRVAVTLRDEEGRTDLRLAQRVDDDAYDPADIEAGWSWYLDRLGAALNGGAMPAWEDYAPAH